MYRGDYMERKIYSELKEWKENGIEKPLMVIGARQIGKTYIIKKFCEKEFEKYVYINLFEHSEIIEIFKRNISTIEKFKMMKIALNIDIDLENTIIFFDEIQESEELISSLKYFNEAPESYKIICAGSLLGVKLKRMSKAFPVGRVKMLTMYPMDFEEFLMATSGKEIIEEIKLCYKESKPIDQVLHEKLLQLYRYYLCIGGMPDVINNFIKNTQDIVKVDKTIVEDIITSYMNDMTKYVSDKTETVRIERIYNSIPMQLTNLSNKFQYGKIENNARRKNYETALEWLLSSTMVLQSNLLTKVEIPPKAFLNLEYYKLYLSDVGLLTSQLEINYGDIIFDKTFQYKGALAENYVATQLASKNLTLMYWESGNQAEIDFILYNDDGIIPIEVKANDNVTSKSLNVYINRYNPEYAIRVSSKNFGFANGIKSVPLYAVFCIE